MPGGFLVSVREWLGRIVICRSKAEKVGSRRDSRVHEILRLALCGGGAGSS
jgi:hypothetical protein